MTKTEFIQTLKSELKHCQELLSNIEKTDETLISIVAVESRCIILEEVIGLASKLDDDSDYDLEPTFRLFRD